VTKSAMKIFTAALAAVILVSFSASCGKKSSSGFSTANPTGTGTWSGTGTITNTGTTSGTGTATNTGTSTGPIGGTADRVVLCELFTKEG